METKLAYLVDTAKEWQCKMKNSRLDCLDGNFSLQNVIMPATTFTQVQCKSVMSPILTQGLLSASYICTFQHALAHSPLKCCGVNIPSLYTKQTLAHIHTLQKISNQPQDLTRFLLWATGETMRLELRLTSQLFEAPLFLQELVTEMWMKQTWLATRKANIHLMIDIPDFPLNQHGDKDLVCAFLQCSFCQLQLSALHWCCMFLQVLCMLDICSRSGNKIITRIWRNYHPINSKYQWPKTAKPNAADWSTWDITILSIFQVSWYLNISQKLGMFYPSKSIGWYYNPDEQALWKNLNNHWSQHSKIPSWSCTLGFHWQGEEHKPLLHVSTKQQYRYKTPRWY